MTASSRSTRIAKASESVPRASVTPTSASSVRPSAAGSTSAAKPVMTPVLAQPADAVRGGVRAQPDGGAEVAPRETPVRAEQPDDLTVDRVHDRESRSARPCGACAPRPARGYSTRHARAHPRSRTRLRRRHPARPDVAVPRPLDARGRLVRRPRGRRRDRASSTPPTPPQARRAPRRCSRFGPLQTAPRARSAPRSSCGSPPARSSSARRPRTIEGAGEPRPRRGGHSSPRSPPRRPTPPRSSPGRRCSRPPGRRARRTPRAARRCSSRASGWEASRGSACSRPAPPGRAARSAPRRSASRRRRRRRAARVRRRARAALGR